ncbi:hypothetical protein LXA43DRAFT_902527 [Ganoderma leucocontextum]|nr:hypothetical protein LXA43DRAFT_902527 [Ganoderma leucocontextum]
MKSFFALATTVALALTPCATANPVPPGAPVHFFTSLRGGLVFGATRGRPAPGAPLVIAPAGDGSPADPTTFALAAGTDRAPAPIRLLGGHPDQPLCVTGRGAGGPAPNRPATLDRCNGEDGEQYWLVGGRGPTTVSNTRGECITIPNGGPSVGQQVRLVHDETKVLKPS